MKSVCYRALALLIVLFLLLAVCAACKGPPLPEGAAPNDILTFTPNVENKPIIRIGTQYYSPDETLVQLIQAKYPQYQFVLDYSTAAGIYSGVGLFESLERDNAHYDLLITGSFSGADAQKHAMCVDLSGERFLDDYLLGALNSVSIDGHVYMIPGTSTLTGIAYNVDMFRAHGWQVPETVDEFFALCAKIRQAGIAPFSACFKYEGAINRLLTMMNYSSFFQTEKGMEWLQNVQSGTVRYKGCYEPVYDIAKRLYDDKILTIDTFTASLTKQRNDFWAGQYAMIDYDSTIFTYAEAEGASFELGIMPYPSREAGGAGFAIMPEYYFSIPKCVEEDPERLAFMKELLAFISSPEGQSAMLRDSLRISNVRGVKLGENAAAKYAAKAYERGNLYPIVTYDHENGGAFFNIEQQAVRMLFEGASVADSIAFTDEKVAEALSAPPSDEPMYEVIAKAEQGFTMLETSYYIADQFKALTGADIGMMINGGFFRSNLAHISEGDITTDMRRFVLKGVGNEDYLTTYTLTGAQIKQMLEHPIVNDAEIDALPACAGLKFKYAPWNERGNRVLGDVTLDDGSPLLDGQTYSVAAWAGAIDARYITSTVQAYDTLGTFAEIMEAAFRKDGSIKPALAGRITLVWPEGN